MGKVIRVLRDDFENFIDKGLSETDIYHTDIILTEPTHSNLTLRGKFYYLLFIKMARMSLKWYFKDLTVTATHFNVIEDLKTVSIRWKLEGTSRPANIFTSSDHLEPSIYEGVFTYKLSESGKVIVHKIDSIYPTPYFDRLLPKLAWWWWLRRSKPELSLSSSLPSRKE
ncbi:hypothetical protein CONCODRAFT_79862 [Conidiobolus coronatus NRRL 28638]|uniref:SnoaL-like domain-containing protein n=1 Tax=Conidiobolus coronatus (strain ATCC 28846 / CBS 209.66 / NRRL 28638) TaxID=796925 RepID=A0A137NZF0_CONC2|nr:hypothetical protein CONCODRAFT_79862 [Conidiobolus coronatus NRRL 28638]|eukprot:KXN68185.1 hypothetical protein CONCODRAFT_79862 [Conidiobolus coronatus NRRL 28638]